MATEYLFRYRFNDGQIIRYNIDINGFLDVKTPLGTNRTPIELELGISQEIVSVDPGKARIEVSFSKAKAGNAMPSVPLPAIGQVSVMEMTDTGLVRWIKGEGAWQGAEYSQMQFPQKALKIGEKWEQISEATSGSAVPIKTVYKLKRIDKKNEQAIFDSEILSPNLVTQGFFPIGKGWFSFDQKNQWIKACNCKIDYEYSMPLPENPALNITTTTNLRIDMEIVEQ